MYYELYHVALMTGMRIGELLGLRWANVDFEARRIYVVEQYNERTDTFDDLKTSGSRRYIALDDETLAVFRERKKETSGTTAQSRVLGEPRSCVFDPERAAAHRKECAQRFQGGNR